MDYTVIGASIATGILSIGGVAVFVSKSLPTIIKYFTIVTKAFSIIDDLLSALKDNTITADEIKKIEADALALKASWEAK